MCWDNCKTKLLRLLYQAFLRMSMSTRWLDMKPLKHLVPLQVYVTDSLLFYSLSFVSSFITFKSQWFSIMNEHAGFGILEDDQSISLLKEFASDSEPIVSESCEVALSMLEFERSGKSFEVSIKRLYSKWVFSSLLKHLL